MQTQNQSVTLNNGDAMPLIGLGVFQSKPEETANAVKTALATGYRLIDTAAAYNNEREVGEGMRESGIPRSDIFVTSKLWMTDYGKEKTRDGFGVSLRKLGLDYIDLYLLHWPMPADFASTVAAYRELKGLVREGKVRAIGVSNFSPTHLQDLMAQTGVVPAVNQVELHPFLIQRELRAFHEQHGIVTEAWSPIGGVYSRNPKAAPEGFSSPLVHPTVLRLAQKYGKTPGQVVLRWHIEHGVVSIPKSTKAERIAENFAVFDFELTPEEVTEIDGLDTGKRAGSDPETVKADTFPIRIGE